MSLPWVYVWLFWLSLEKEEMVDIILLCDNTPNKLLLSESAVSFLLLVRSVSFTSRAKGCIKFIPHSCLVSLSHKVSVFLEEAICYFIDAKFAVIHKLFIHHLSIGGWFKRMELIEVKSLIWAQKGKLYIIYENVMWILGILRFKSIHLLFYTIIHMYTRYFKW